MPSTSPSADGRSALACPYAAAHGRPGNDRALGKPKLSVGFVLADNFTLSAFALFIGHLRLAADEGDRSRPILCRWSIMGSRPEPVPASCGVTVGRTSGFVDPRQLDYIVVVGGILHAGPQVDEQTVAYLQAAARAGVRLVGICTGSFILCRAGLMTGRRCCVSWYHCQDFLDEFPHHHPVADRLFVIDGDRITCSGGGGVADLATHLIDLHIGRAVAQKGRHVLLLDRARPGTGAQPHPPIAEGIADERVRRAVLLMEQHRADPLPIADLATRLRLSTRQLERLFGAVTGQRPAAFYRTLRLRYARWLLDHTDRSITDIALEAGFADCAHFSRQFKAMHGLTPSGVRRGAARDPRPHPPPRRWPPSGCSTERGNAAHVDPWKERVVCTKVGRRGRWQNARSLECPSSSTAPNRLTASHMAQNSLKSLVARRKPGFTLEAPFYVSPEIFETDLDLIFGRHWIYVGVEPDVPEPGDCMVVDIGRSSIIIARDDDMNVQAYHNVCRHRGARLVHEPKTSVGNIVCRYHQWTYGLDGRLLFAENMGESFDTSCRGLKPVHVRSVAGLLFVCLAAEPPTDIDDVARAMEPYIAPHDVRNCKVAKQIDLIEPGNWKLTMENNRECYHCSANHPELTVSIFEFGFGFAPSSVDEARREQIRQYDCMVDDLHGQWEASGLPSREIDHLDDRVTGFRTQRLPIDRAGESQTLDTRVASKKLLGTLADPKLGGLSFWTQPNGWHHFMSDHIVTFSVIPIEPERTLLRTKWLVHKDAVEGVDYEVDNLTTVWEATNAQDSELVGIAHAGAREPAYEPGPYSPYTEGLVEKFSAWYVGRLSTHLGR